MRIHSNLITASHIYTAADYAGLRGVYGHVFVENLEQRGSRTRLRAWNFHLRGDGSVFRRRPNTGKRGGDGEDYAATWCQWGDFLASLYAVDPDMHCAYYANADDYHRRTAGAFAGIGMGPCEMRACSACRGRIGIPSEVRWAPVPQPTRNIPEEVQAMIRAAQRASRPPAPAAIDMRPSTGEYMREVTQRDIIAEIERTLDTCVAPQPAITGDTAFMEAGELADDPCGYRFC